MLTAERPLVGRRFAEVARTKLGARSEEVEIVSGLERVLGLEILLTGMSVSDSSAFRRRVFGVGELTGEEPAVEGWRGVEDAYLGVEEGSLGVEGASLDEDEVSQSLGVEARDTDAEVLTSILSMISTDSPRSTSGDGSRPSQ